ncbi:hypothetical protein SKAU_G00275490 [Synaphobranchus kaupii]|uniref:Uncharacterized protein n=1 Tax=Synaphobranchus kaupii TaxID=118154 RepID=A0A9Q1IQ49_SYNKA|nr:hypothetical protein SKAU_G00275490 [Synaphobranchus kaupii]
MTSLHSDSIILTVADRLVFGLGAAPLLLVTIILCVKCCRKPGVNTAIVLGCAPNKRTETLLKRWSRYASKRTLVRFVCGENVIRPPSDPTAESTAHFWTKRAPVASYAVHYGMRKTSICPFATTTTCEHDESE